MLLVLTAGSYSSLANTLTPYRGLAAALGLGWCVGGWWLRSNAAHRRRIGVIILSSGNIAALALLFHSPLWIWELNESWPVKPVANFIRESDGKEIKLKGYEERPSLNWYAERRIPRLEGGEGLRLSDKPLEGCEIVKRTERWTLANCN